MLTTQDQVIAELRQANSNKTGRDDDLAFILKSIDQAQARIEARTAKWFAPHVATRKFDACQMEEGGPLDGETLWLDRGLVELDSIINNGTTLDTSDYLLYPDNEPHYSRIVRLNGYWGYSGTPLQAISVTGTWCHHSNRASMWLNSGDTVQADISASDAGVVVSDSAGENAAFESPRFSPGQLIKIDDEFMQIRKITVASGPTVHTLGLLRGVNGSTPAAHSTGAVIYTFQPQPDIEKAATRWAAYLYQHKAQYAKTEVEGMNAKRWPDDAPSDVEAILVQYTEWW